MCAFIVIYLWGGYGLAGAAMGRLLPVAPLQTEHLISATKPIFSMTGGSGFTMGLFHFGLPNNVAAFISGFAPSPTIG
jgi:hypothetical protein